MSATLTAAINHQLTTRTKRNAQGQLLCRRCNKVVPPEYSIVFWDPSDESVCWGPCCSDECICHLKICSECNQDFIIDKAGEITHVGEGVWLCKDCITKVEVCPYCNKKGSLVDSPSGKMCKRCFNKKYFTCMDCKSLHSKENSAENKLTGTELVQWSHVLNGEEGLICKACFNQRANGKDPLPVGRCNCCNGVFNLHGRSDLFCERCIDRGDVRLCEHCGIYSTRWDHISGKTYCRTCSSKVTICECCKDNSFFNEEGVKYKGRSKTYLICKECDSTSSTLEECPSCLSLTNHPLRKVEGKKEVCNHCKSHYNWCSECKEFHFMERHCRKDGVSVCDYSYKPHPYFNGSLNDRVFFGFENEINYIEDNYTLAKDTVLKSYPSNILYAKRDSSIAGSGFEVVSHPMSFEFFNTLDLEPMFRVKPRERDTSCGLHVHISRSSFNGQAHLFKLTEFINNNKPFTKKIAGRDFNSYAKEYQDKISKAVKGTSYRERYHAVNLTNKKTVEIRIFKSARNEYQLRYRIEFVSAAVEYTRNASIKNLSDSDFKLWLKGQPGYSELKKFLKVNK